MRKVRAALVVVMLFGVAACSHDTTPAGAQRSSGPSVVPIPPTVSAESPTPVNPLALYLKAGGGVLVANPDLTPGHAMPGITAAAICAPGYGLNEHRSHYGTRAAVLAAYGLTWSARDQYQFDDLIPAVLGGDDAKTNLWPMPLTGTAQPALKIALGNRLHDLVCSNKLSLAAAQAAIASNWWAAYQLYGRPLPVLQEVATAVCSAIGARAETSTRRPLVCAVAPDKKPRWAIVSPTPSPTPSGTAVAKASASAAVT